MTENTRLLKSGLTEDEKKKISNFANWMLQIGEGRVPSIQHRDDKDTSWIEIPKDLLLSSYTNPIESIFLATYPNFDMDYNNIDYLKERAIVTPRNSTAYSINNYAINLVPGDKTIYYSSDTISADSLVATKILIFYIQQNF